MWDLDSAPDDLEVATVDLDMTEMGERLVASCADLLDVTTVSVLLAGESGGLTLLASSDRRAGTLELLWRLAGEPGPCLTCLSTGSAVTVAGLSGWPGRRPRFSTDAWQQGFGTVHALPMMLGERLVGVLCLLRSGPSPLPPERLADAQAMADLLTVAIPPVAPAPAV